MKKLTALFMAGIMVLGMTACGQGGTSGNGAPDSPVEKETDSPAVEESVETAQADGTDGGGKSAILIVNGNLGDLGFFHSAQGCKKRKMN